MNGAPHLGRIIPRPSFPLSFFTPFRGVLTPTNSITICRPSQLPAREHTGRLPAHPSALQLANRWALCPLHASPAACPFLTISFERGCQGLRGAAPQCPGWPTSHQASQSQPVLSPFPRPRAHRHLHPDGAEGRGSVGPNPTRTAPGSGRGGEEPSQGGRRVAASGGSALPSGGELQGLVPHLVALRS